jgi:hypothetical protein
MREISNDELGQVCGGLKASGRMIKHPDDEDIKLHPVPYARDGMPQIPTNPDQKLEHEPNVVTTSSPTSPNTTTPSIHMDYGRRPRRPIRHLMSLSKNMNSDA